MAIAYDEGGRELAEVHLTGVDGYTFTARILAWASARIAADGLPASGALAPVEAFGLRDLAAGVAEAGITASGTRPWRPPTQPAHPAIRRPRTR